jgi:hypothetical protein
MATRPTRPQRWPRNAEAHRQQAIEDVVSALELLADARRELRRNELLAELQIADAMTYLERVRRVMTEARLGVEASEDDQR